jgi:uncharacterized membrane protein YkvA (DUF1232 family)
MEATMVTANDAQPQTTLEAATSDAPSETNGASHAIPKARDWLERALKHAAQTVGQRYLERLTASRGNIRESLGLVPDRIQRTAQQTRLVLELLDDVRGGAYQEVHWYSLPIAAAALLYAIAPADLLPDVLPAVGVFDDVAVLAVAVRVLQGELRAYCRFKGYSEEQYFAAA